MSVEITTFFDAYVQAVTHNLFLILVLICVAADTLFGCLRAVRYRCWNSSIGIDGGIRKVTMVLSVVILALVDQLVGLDVISWLPEDVAGALSTVGINALGLAEFFAIVYILYEASSILKNLLLCGVPLWSGLQDKLAKWVDDMTDESSVSVRETLASPDRQPVLKSKK